MQYQNSYDVYECEDCGLLFLNPMISEEELHNLYPKGDYYAYSEIKPFNLKTKKGIVQKIKNLQKDTEGFFWHNDQDPLYPDLVRQYSIPFAMMTSNLFTRL